MDLMDLARDRVKILAEGIWREDQVEVSVNSTFLPLIPSEMREIAKVRFLEKKKKNLDFYDGNVFHLNVEHSNIAEDHVFFALGKITYSLYNVCRKEVAEKYGWDLWSLPVGSGTAAVVLTSDGKIVMHDRLDNSKSCITGIYEVGTPFDNMRKEMREELKVEGNNITNMLLLGMSYRMQERLGQSFTFLVETNLCADRIMALQEELEEEEKEGDVFFLDVEPSTLHDFLVKNHENIAASGFASLVLVGRYLWGKEWSRI